MAGELRIVTGPGSTVYANVLNEASRRWNGTSFEAYNSSNYDNYANTTTEQGSSGVYVGDFPVAITTGGRYEVVFYLQEGAAPAEGDRVCGTGVIDWDGDSISTPSEETVAGELSGTDWLVMVLRTFKRTDKNVEVFDKTNDAISEIRRRFPTQRDETEVSVTDTISSLGQFRLDLEGDFGLLVSDIFIQDTNDGYYLSPISKQEYDRRYGIWGTSSQDRNRPCHYALFGGQIWLGPVPDRIDYTYKISYNLGNITPVDAASTSIPYTTPDYREILLFGTLWRLYAMVENDDQAGKYKAFWDDKTAEMELKEKRNRRVVYQTTYNDV